jgi:hypothetical protein
VKKLVVDKEKCQIWHAMKRAKERLGFRLTEELFAQMVSVIKNGKTTDKLSAQFLEKQSRRCSLYQLNLKPYKPFNVVYDNSRQTIVTFLFQEDEKLIYHYYDVFGNRVATKEVTGKYWRYNPDTKQLKIDGEELTPIGENKWSTGYNLSNMILEMKDGHLCQAMT